MKREEFLIAKAVEHAAVCTSSAFSSSGIESELINDKEAVETIALEVRSRLTEGQLDNLKVFLSLIT